MCVQQLNKQVCDGTGKEGAQEQHGGTALQRQHKSENHTGKGGMADGIPDERFALENIECFLCLVS